MIKLTWKQLSAINTIKWLIDDRERATGRSIAVAYTYILLGLENPGIPFFIQDLGNKASLHPHNIRYIIKKMIEIMKENYPDVKYKFKVYDNTFEVIF